jgi:anti-sigma factor RsiW
VNCREFVEFMMNYLDGELEPDSRTVFDQHLEGCSCCVAYMESYKKAIEMGRCACKDEEGPVPDDAPDELIRAIMAARKAG